MRFYTDRESDDLLWHDQEGWDKHRFERAYEDAVFTPPVPGPVGPVQKAPWVRSLGGPWYEWEGPKDV